MIFDRDRDQPDWTNKPPTMIQYPKPALPRQKMNPFVRMQDRPAQSSLAEIFPGPQDKWREDRNRRRDNKLARMNQNNISDRTLQRTNIAPLSGPTLQRTGKTQRKG